MYIFKVKKTSHTIAELSDLDCNPKPGDPKIAAFEPLNRPYADSAPDHYTIFHEVAYWRKFNALHQWFVTNVQLGVDDCRLYEIDRDDLRDSLATLTVANEMNDSSVLPTAQGFFWGSTEADDYYWNAVKSSIKTISNLIYVTDWDSERLFYQSSW